MGRGHSCGSPGLCARPSTFRSQLGAGCRRSELEQQIKVHLHNGKTFNGEFVERDLESLALLTSRDKKTKVGRR